MNPSAKKSSFFKKIIISIALFGALGAGIVYYVSVPRGPIYELNESRDTQNITKLFKKNYYWLVDYPGYSPEFMLKYRTPKKDPRYFGKMQVKVLRENDTFIGFCAYYMESADVGFFNFLVIEDEFRGKHYGEQLMRYALDDFKRMGAKKVWLVTRTSNASALKLYARVGFRETSRTQEGFVYFDYVF